MASGGLASAAHPPAVWRSAGGHSPDPPGLRRPQARHPPAGQPESRAALPALQVTGPRRVWPTLCDGATARGPLPQMADGRGKRRRGSHRQSGTGAVRGSAAEEDCPVGPVPPPGVVEIGHPTGGGPDGGVPWGW